MKSVGSMQRRVLLGLALCLALHEAPARAEKDEITSGLQGGLMLPGFSPKSKTAFTLATWSIGAFGQYGLLDDLYLTLGFSFSTFGATANGYRYQEGGGYDHEGNLDFTARLYHPELGARYKLFAGYDLAPYLDVTLGYAWTTYHSVRFQDVDQDIPDFGEDALTLGVGVSLDYRLFNMLFVGIGFKYNHFWGDRLFQSYMSIPLQVSYYWF